MSFTIYKWLRGPKLSNYSVNTENDQFCIYLVVHKELDIIGLCITFPSLEITQSWSSPRQNMQLYNVVFLMQVRKITFTGSTGVGKILMTGAAKTVKKVGFSRPSSIYTRKFHLQHYEPPNQRLQIMKRSEDDHAFQPDIIFREHLKVNWVRRGTSRSLGNLTT